MTAPTSNRTSTASPPVAGKYRLIFELGRGGMADVMLAVIQGPGGFNKLQVLKLLRQELAAEPEFCTMFLEEARLSARINHPNVAQTNEVGFDGERYFIAMEYLEGQSLDEVMRRARSRGVPLPLAVVLRAMCDACGGLHYAHELKDFDGTPLHVIHRDVSPQNVFVTYDGITKLLDFGIAKASDSNIRTQAGTIKGKIAYMAPEQLLGVSHIDRRADIFSVGSVLWRSITGKRMWAGASEMEILQSLANHKIPEPIPLPGIPEELVRICRKAISANPNDRYPTALALKAELEHLLATLPGNSHSDVSTFLNDLFAERRQEIAQAIEARLSTAESPGITATRSLPRLGPNNTTTGSLPSASLLDMGTSGNYAAMPNTDVSIVAPSAPQRHWGIVAAVLVAGGLVAAALVARPRGETNTPTTSPVASAPTTVSAAPAKLETEIEFDISPANAVVFIDDVPVAGRPPRGTYPRDGKEHIVRVQAEGYASKTQEVTFDIANLRLPLSLEKEHRSSAPVWRPSGGGGKRASSGTAPAAPPPSSAPAAPPPSETAPPPQKPARPGVDTIDKDDPWKK
ncbi:serine/threonine protein kinase [Pendulispora albinea]|uniref:non-specific serine/threonine protein kinase n=1 Tax=Pendulispora albinea TaxID=2741071 RepID=A0ABZ2MAK6_9BACT